MKYVNDVVYLRTFCESKKVLSILHPRKIVI